jgi:hypothetical protein
MDCFVAKESMAMLFGVVFRAESSYAWIEVGIVVSITRFQQWKTMVKSWRFDSLGSEENTIVVLR